MDKSFDLVALIKLATTHKIRPTQFVSVAGGVKKRLESNIKNRKSSRLTDFDRIRNITKCDSPKAPSLSDAQLKALHRKQQLEKWKAEKDKKKKEAAAQKKKPFIAGVSQRSTFGPAPPPKPMPSTSGRVTRSQARQRFEPKPSSSQTKSFAPSNAAFKPSLYLGSEVPTLATNKKKVNPKINITFEPVLPKNLLKETKTTRSTRAKPVLDNNKKPNEKAKAKVTVRPPTLKQQMFQSSSSSSDMEQPSKLRSKPSLRKSITKTQQKPLPKAQASSSQGSACVLVETASMSSQDASTSQDTASMSSQDEISTPRNKVPRSESSSEEKLRLPLTPEIVDKAKNISPNVIVSRGKKNARKEMKKKLDEGLLDEDNSNMERVNYFRRQLNSEIAHITAMCEEWDLIFAQTVLPESIQELVLTAVGQARLLMSEKMQQFAKLVESCAHPTPGAHLVTPADLHGFWDMVFMQVDNVVMRFKYLERLRLRDWVEEQEPAPPVVARPPARKAAPKPSGGPSRLREMIAAARKAKKVQESQSESLASEKSEPTAPPETKTFDAGFFRVSSPMKRSPAPGTPRNKPSLLKTVLSIEAKKSVSKESTPYAMMQASLKSKNLDLGVAVLELTPAPVNLDATPARSILKQRHAGARATPRPKSVLFRTGPSPACGCGEPEPEPEPELEPELEPEPEPEPEPPSDNKENEDRRPVRQDAVDRPSPIMTRSRRRSQRSPLVDTPAGTLDVPVENKRSTRKAKEAPQETETPKRSTRRRKSTLAL